MVRGSGTLRKTLPLILLPLSGCTAGGPDQGAQTALEICGDPALPATAATPTEILPSDRVGFPENFRENYLRFYTFDRFDAGLISRVCANEIAARVEPGGVYPYGSVLLSEAWRPVRDAGGEYVLDEGGRLIPGELTGVFLMRKEEGLGAGYGTDRSGEWEYVAFRPDGTYLTAPEASASCAACHNVGIGASHDFVFRTGVRFMPGQYARTDLLGEGEIGISRMSFQAGARTVPVGTTVTWRNSMIDETLHQIAGGDGALAFASAVLAPGEAFSHTFTEPGRYEFVCPLHPVQMRGVIEVTE